MGSWAGGGGFAGILRHMLHMLTGCNTLDAACRTVFVTAVGYVAGKECGVISVGLFHRAVTVVTVAYRAAASIKLLLRSQIASCPVSCRHGSHEGNQDHEGDEGRQGYDQGRHRE